MSNLQDIEDSLNIVSYLRSYNESYRGTSFVIVQTTKQDWAIILTTNVLPQRLESYKEAFTYAMGYIDGCIQEQEHD